jgi:hypothetical protein
MITHRTLMGPSVRTPARLSPIFWSLAFELSSIFRTNKP